MSSTTVPWKKKLIQVRNLRDQGADLNYERVKTLIDIYNDEQFRIDNGHRGEPLDDAEAAEFLDTEVSDLCADFLQLKAIFSEFPKKEQWIKQRLDLMLAKTLAKQDERRKNAKPPSKPKADPITRKEYSRMQQNFIRATEENTAIKKGTRIPQLEKELKSATESLHGTEALLAGANKEIKRLMTENNRLRAKITKLEAQNVKLKSQLAGKSRRKTG